jgi:hypothetical protein
VVFAEDPDVGGLLVEGWIRAFGRELVLDAAKVASAVPDAAPAREPGERVEA